MTTLDGEAPEASSLRRSLVLWLIFACVAAAAAFLLYERYRSPTYRYKLTVSVDTADGVKTAFNVVEVEQVSFSFPQKGVVASVRGEALYLDLGPKRRPLVALLSRKFRIPSDRKLRGRWGESDPTMLIGSLHGDPLEESVWFIAQRVEKYRGAREAPLETLPDLVTFADVRDPKSVLAVDHANLAATLGSDVSWRSVTIEVTNEPLTSGIEAKLPWLKTIHGYLSGKSTRTSNDLPSVLDTSNFRRQRAF